MISQMVITLVEILKGMMSTSTSSPLEDDRKIGTGCSDVDDLVNTIYGSRFECYMSNSSSLQVNLDSFLSGRNTGSDTEAFDWKTLLAHFLPQRKLKSELMWINV